jgi:hypothetical protein
MLSEISDVVNSGRLDIAQFRWQSDEMLDRFQNMSMAQNVKYISEQKHLKETYRNMNHKIWTQIHIFHWFCMGVKIGL